MTASPPPSIHGNKSQNARQKAMSSFRDGEARILVATDIAARGIDVPGISHVINFDLPDEAESYVHRIGRTGRNGASGVAVTLCDPGEAAKLRQVERLVRMSLPVVADHTGAPDPQRPPREAAANQAGAHHAARGGPRQGHKPGGGKPPAQRQQPGRVAAAEAQRAPGTRPQRNRRRRFGQRKAMRAA